MLILSFLPLLTEERVLCEPKCRHSIKALERGQWDLQADCSASRLVFLSFWKIMLGRGVGEGLVTDKQVLPLL